MKKIYIFIFSFTIALFIFRPLQLRSQDVSIGYRTGFYLSHSVSVEKYINRFTSIEVNAGHRFNGGLINQSSENFSRTGAIINVKQFFHRSFDPYYYSITFGGMIICLLPLLVSIGVLLFRKVRSYF